MTNVRSERPRSQVRAGETARGEKSSIGPPGPSRGGVGGQLGQWPPDMGAAGPVAPGPMHSLSEGKGQGNGFVRNPSERPCP